MAVATQAEGFRTLAELVGALVFHAVISLVGAQLLLVAVRIADKEQGRAAEEPRRDVAPSS